MRVDFREDPASVLDKTLNFIPVFIRNSCEVE